MPPITTGDGSSIGRGPIWPAQFQVRFQGRRCFGDARDDVSVPRWWTETINLADVLVCGPATGVGKKPFNDTALALFDNMGLTNGPALNALAKQISKDYVGWRCISFDTVYNGVIVPAAQASGGNSLCDIIEWSVDANDQTTRLITAPWGVEPEEYQHNDPANADCVDSTGVVVSQAPCVSVYGPLAKCVSGWANIVRYKICLEDGRLFERYIENDFIQ